MGKLPDEGTGALAALWSYQEIPPGNQLWRLKMSLINDYSISSLAAQRQYEFQLEAANDRLARIAMGERPRRARKVRRSHHLFGSVRPASAR